MHLCPSSPRRAPTPWSTRLTQSCARTSGSPPRFQNSRSANPLRERSKCEPKIPVPGFRVRKLPHSKPRIPGPGFPIPDARFPSMDSPHAGLPILRSKHCAPSSCSLRNRAAPHRSRSSWSPPCTDRTEPVPAQGLPAQQSMSASCAIGSRASAHVRHHGLTIATGGMPPRSRDASLPELATKSASTVEHLSDAEPRQDLGLPSSLPQLSVSQPLARALEMRIENPGTGIPRSQSAALRTANPGTGIPDS